MHDGALSQKNLDSAIASESALFKEHYGWITAHMPPSFFEEIEWETLVLIVHSLMSFHLQHFISRIDLKNQAIVLCLDSPRSDLDILEQYHLNGIKHYRTYISNSPPPFPNVTSNLRIALIDFTDIKKPTDKAPPQMPAELKKEIFSLLKQRNPLVTEETYTRVLSEVSHRFLLSLNKDRMVLALDLYCQACSKDPCQYVVRYNEDWDGKKDTPSMQVIFAWRNVPKHRFLYRIAKTIYRHGLSLKRVSATYVHPYSKDSVLIMSIGLHGIEGKVAWQEANVEDLVRELVTIKYFEEQEVIESTFVDSGLLSGNMGNLVKSIASFAHQVLVHADVNLYSLPNIEEAVCRHPELIVHLCQAFSLKFNPDHHDVHLYQRSRDIFLDLVDQLDTGHEMNDTRRKNVLRLMMSFVHNTLKTNFFRNNKTAFSFRLTPQILEDLPFDRKERFPELPYAIFYIKGRYYLGFHIRFKNLSRGGLRTIFPQKMEQMVIERNYVLSECYSLAYTQNKKNKDIPEGGAKGVIFLEPYERLLFEAEIYRKELERSGFEANEIEEKLQHFHTEQKLEYLYQSQRSYIESFLTLLNCNPDGTLRAKRIVDYWKNPEYIYLGPDENMHNVMIEWISTYSQYYDYKPGRSFISSKPGAGINHKEYGVTSLGVNVYMEEVLRFLGIDPHKTPFTVKITGGPDGDVAGNQILNLKKYYPKTAKLVAITDVSGTIYDPNGLDLDTLARLFHEVKPIRFYPPQLLSEGGFLLDLNTKREQTAYAYQTLCWKKEKGELKEHWLSGNEMNHLYRSNIMQTKTDIFIPGGGRPRTINEKNYHEFLDQTGRPTSRAIVEGANLFLTSAARKALEKLGVLIIKDSSANKGGVVCSSFEVLAGLVLSEQEFIHEKNDLMLEILQIIKDRAHDEARLLLENYRPGEAFLTDLSDHISEKIIVFRNELLDFLDSQALSENPSDPLIRCLLNYCPERLRRLYSERILKQIPDHHKKAIIACYIASRIVYKRGLNWNPTVVDVLPLIAKDPSIIG